MVVRSACSRWLNSAPTIEAQGNFVFALFLTRINQVNVLFATRAVYTRAGRLHAVREEDECDECMIRSGISTHEDVMTLLFVSFAVLVLVLRVAGNIHFPKRVVQQALCRMDLLLRPLERRFHTDLLLLPHP